MKGARLHIRCNKSDFRPISKWNFGISTAQVKLALQTLPPDKAIDNSSVRTTQTQSISPPTDRARPAAPPTETMTQHGKSGTSRVHNLTNAPIPPHLPRVLKMGPKFALSRPINKRVMEDAEVGFERGAFALRWRYFIESKHSGTVQKIVQKPS